MKNASCKYFKNEICFCDLTKIRSSESHSRKNQPKRAVFNAKMKKQVFFYFGNKSVARLAKNTSNLLSTHT